MTRLIREVGHRMAMLDLGIFGCLSWRQHFAYLLFGILPGTPRGRHNG
jgi:hypothetical protein